MTVVSFGNTKSHQASLTIEGRLLGVIDNGYLMYGRVSVSSPDEKRIQKVE